MRRASPPAGPPPRPAPVATTDARPRQRPAFDLQLLSRFPEALLHYQQALDLTERAYGKLHPERAIVLANVGQALGYVGHFGESLAVQREALARLREVLGKSHREIGYSL